MEEVRKYIISVTAAALLCGIITGIIGKKGSYCAIIKLLSGLFLAYTVIAPWTKIRLADFSNFTDDLSAEAEQYVQDGIIYAYSESAAIIKTKTEAYILDKAASMGLDIEVEVKLGSSDPPLPESAIIKGSVSPYAKEMLQVWFYNDLGIPKENLLWI